ncbi:hypothetical protein [uncultured Megasphaera sp.]|uniref:hypothetical protein n=1 Tax=uncultured Megasphaera sp. TaxID=165188 RepID=UPI002594D937|nr:hypothetical protein [uncultured Megasphaera sp.]
MDGINLEIDSLFSLNNSNYFYNIPATERVINDHLFYAMGGLLFGMYGYQAFTAAGVTDGLCAWGSTERNYGSLYVFSAGISAQKSHYGLEIYNANGDIVFSDKMLPACIEAVNPPIGRTFASNKDYAMVYFNAQDQTNNIRWHEDEFSGGHLTGHIKRTQPIINAGRLRMLVQHGDVYDESISFNTWEYEDTTDWESTYCWVLDVTNYPIRWLKN